MLGADRCMYVDVVFVMSPVQTIKQFTIGEFASALPPTMLLLLLRLRLLSRLLTLALYTPTLRLFLHQSSRTSSI